MRVLTFIITYLETGQRAGHALICQDARYASIAWRDGERLDRRFVNAADWVLLTSELKLGIPPTPLEATDVIVRILLDANWRRRVTVQYVSDQTIDVEAPLRLVERLDAMLQQMAA